MGQLRLDKWLWFARVVKSRTLAAGLVEEGKVRLNRERTTKPSQTVRVGDVLTIAVGPRIRVLEVAAIGSRRGPASEAQALYVDRSPPMRAAPTEPPAGGERPSGTGRPTKRDRRQIDRLTEPD
jgi:ribosome-associated heat shock protein Hsp15